MVYKWHFLPKCNVIVTSRQLSTLDIRQYSNRTIHVVGYTNAQIQKYIHLYFEEANVAEKLIADLQAFPNVMNTYHLVVNLAIVCFIYEADGMRLPTTVTEVYKQFVFHKIKRHVHEKRKSVLSKQDISQVKGLLQFDGEIGGMLDHLGLLALSGIEQNDYNFENSGVSTVDSLDFEYDGFGLLQSYKLQRRFGI